MGAGGDDVPSAAATPFGGTDGRGPTTGTTAAAAGAGGTPASSSPFSVSPSPSSPSSTPSSPPTLSLSPPSTRAGSPRPCHSLAGGPFRLPPLPSPPHHGVPAAIVLRVAGDQEDPKDVHHADLARPHEGPGGALQDDYPPSPTTNNKTAVPAPGGEEAAGDCLETIPAPGAAPSFSLPQRKRKRPAKGGTATDEDPRSGTPPRSQKDPIGQDRPDVPPIPGNGRRRTADLPPLISPVRPPPLGGNHAHPATTAASTPGLGDDAKTKQRLQQQHGRHPHGEGGPDLRHHHLSKDRHESESPILDVDDTDDDWGYEDHRNFVAAILNVGISSCAPTSIREQMVAPPIALTGEKMKSHLQKFRHCQTQEIADFMSDYDAHLHDLQHPRHRPHHLHRHQPVHRPAHHHHGHHHGYTWGGTGTNGSSNRSGTTVVMEQLLVGGRAAAALTYQVLKGPSSAAAALETSQSGYDPATFGSNSGAGIPDTEVLLTSDETETPLGKALIFVHGAIEQMSAFLLAERARAEAEAAAAAAAIREREDAVRRAAMEVDPADAALMASEFTFANIGLGLDGEPLLAGPAAVAAAPSPRTIPEEGTDPVKGGSPKPRNIDATQRKVNASKGVKVTVLEDSRGGTKHKPPSPPPSPVRRRRASSHGSKGPTGAWTGDATDDSSCSRSVSSTASVRPPSSLSTTTTTTTGAAATEDGVLVRTKPPSSCPVLPPITGNDAFKFALPPPSTKFLANHVSLQSLASKAVVVEKKVTKKTKKASATQQPTPPPAATRSKEGDKRGGCTGHSFDDEGYLSIVDQPHEDDVFVLLLEDSVDPDDVGGDDGCHPNQTGPISTHPPIEEVSPSE
jgi:SHAQKYF class myb-like DNA-binding protein